MTRSTLSRQRRAGRGERFPALFAMLAMLLAATAPRAAATDEFERIREKAAEMAVAVNEASYAFFGDGQKADLERVYGGYGYLVNADKLAKVDELVAAVTDSAERATHARSASILDYHGVRSMAARVTDTYLNAYRDNIIQVENSKLSLQGLDYRMGLLEDQEARRKWWLAASELHKVVGVYLRSLLIDLDADARVLGHPSYHALLAEVERWDPALMESSAVTLLRETETDYAAALEEWGDRELGLKLRKLRSYDVNRLLFFPSLSAKIKTPRIEELASATLGACGIDLGKQRTLRLDLREKSGRCPYASAHQVSTGKTYVTMAPSGYVTDVTDLLGALGEAQFYHHIPGTVPFEDAYTGNNILPSTYRALFEMITEEPAWIAQHLKPEGVTAEQVSAALELRRTLRMRAAAGRLLFQLKLHADPQISPAAYGETMEAALLWKFTDNDTDGYLLANDDYRSGGLMLGYLFAQQIRAALREEWGEQWYLREELARRLERGAAKGYGMPLDEFLKIWNVDGLDAGLSAEKPAQG